MQTKATVLIVLENTFCFCNLNHLVLNLRGVLAIAIENRTFKHDSRAQKSRQDVVKLFPES
jgi:hypothetical protein